MDVEHLPFENPKIRRSVEHRFVSLMLLVLQPILTPVLADLQPSLPPVSREKERAAARSLRTKTLSRLLKSEQVGLLDAAMNQFVAHQPKSHSVEDLLVIDDDDFGPKERELLLWAIDGLLGKTLRREYSHSDEVRSLIEDPSLDFPDKRKTYDERAGAPQYLYVLAEQLAGVESWKADQVARCLQHTFHELSAEHTREHLQRYYGWGGEANIYYITRRLRSFERYQAAVLKLLENAEHFPLPASWIIGEAWRRQQFRIRRAIEDSRSPIDWVVNWATSFDRIREVMKAEWHSKDFREALDKRKAPLGNKALFIRVSKKDSTIDWTKTREKLSDVQARLDWLRRVGHRQIGIGPSGSATDGPEVEHAPRDLGEVLRWIEAEGVDEDATSDPSTQPLAGSEVPLARLPLATLFDALDYISQPFVKVGVLLRLIERIPIKSDRDRMSDMMVEYWLESRWPDVSLFDRLGVRPLRSSLTERVLAEAAGLTLPEYRREVDDALAQFDVLGALGGETAVLPFGELQRIPDVFVRVAVTLRLLAEVADCSARQKLSEALVETWDNRQSFDGGLFGFLGIHPPSLESLTDEVLAWGCDLDDDIDRFVELVEQALAELRTEAKSTSKRRRRV